MARRAKRLLCVEGSAYESARPARHAPPTDAMPGTPDKVEELRRRYARRQSLFGPGDLVDGEGISRNYVRAGGTFVLDGAEPVRDERGEGEKKGGKNLKKLSGATPGDRMRQARERSGLSARALSLACGLSPSTLGKVERRRAAPCLWTIYRVSSLLGLCPDWLAGLRPAVDARAAS